MHKRGVILLGWWPAIDQGETADIAAQLASLFCHLLDDYAHQCRAACHVGDDSIGIQQFLACLCYRLRDFSIATVRFCQFNLFNVG